MTISWHAVLTEIKKPTSMRWAFLYGACGRIRTSDRLVRSQVLYPAELHTRKLFYFQFLHRKVTLQVSGACGRIRTSDRLVRSQVLYPAELHTRNKLFVDRHYQRIMAEREGFEPSVRINVRFLSRELVSATHPPLLECGMHFTDSLA